LAHNAFTCGPALQATHASRASRSKAALLHQLSQDSVTNAGGPKTPADMDSRSAEMSWNIVDTVNSSSSNNGVVVVMVEEREEEEIHGAM